MGTTEAVSGNQHGDESPSRKLGRLINEMATIVQTYVSLSDPNLAYLIALWIANTYAYKHFSYCGYLAIRSATPACGKSRLLRLIARMSNGNPPVCSSATAATIFRSARPVVILDEADKLRNTDSDSHGQLLAVLNAGFQADGVVERLESSPGSKQWKMNQFPVYGPKAFAGLEALADTLADRAFSIQMVRATQRVKRFNERTLAPAFELLRAALGEALGELAPVIEQEYSNLPESLPELSAYEDRLQDISEPLWVLAKIADRDRPEGEALVPRLLKALAHASTRREASGREKALHALLRILDQTLGEAESAFIPTGNLIALCEKDEDLSWIEKPKVLASLLKHFELAPINTGRQRGYRVTREWVASWQIRYDRAGAEHSATQPPPPSGSNGTSSIPGVTTCPREEDMPSWEEQKRSPSEGRAGVLRISPSEEDDLF